MTIVHDMSDEGLVSQFGDIMHEMPELFEALRRFEIENRPVKGGFKLSMKGVGNETRLQIGNPRSMK